VKVWCSCTLGVQGRSPSWGKKNGGGKEDTWDPRGNGWGAEPFGPPFWGGGGGGRKWPRLKNKSKSHWKNKRILRDKHGVSPGGGGGGWGSVNQQESQRRNPPGRQNVGGVEILTLNQPPTGKIFWRQGEHVSDLGSRKRPSATPTRGPGGSV